MRIIKAGNPPPVPPPKVWRATCDECGCEFEFGSGDYEVFGHCSSPGAWADCPEPGCGRRNSVSKVVFSEEDLARFKEQAKWESDLYEEIERQQQKIRKLKEPSKAKQDEPGLFGCGFMFGAGVLAIILSAWSLLLTR